VYCWDGGALARAAPTTLTYATISAHDDQTCGATTAGEVYCWRRTDAARQVTGLPAVSAVSVGQAHVCALSRDGEPWCWGANDRAQLGIGSVDDSVRAVPHRVHGGFRFRTITTGAGHTCAIAVDGVLYCWGSNQFGQAGTGVFNSPCTVEGLPSDCVREPARVDIPAPVGEADAGDEHTCAVVVTQAYCWGNAANGRLGNRVNGFTATPVAALYPNMRALTAGSTFGCGYHPEVEGLSCWGSNEWGQLFYGWVGGERPEPGNVWFHRPRYLDQ
jgi:alpha-tubulin suppressor-like RCC1 family protein